MTALDVIRDIAEYSRPDFLTRIRADAYRAPNDPADSGAFDAAVDAAADALAADSCALAEVCAYVVEREDAGQEFALAAYRGELTDALLHAFQDAVRAELEDRAKAAIKRHI